MTSQATYTFGAVPGHPDAVLLHLTGEMDETNLPELEMQMEPIVHGKTSGAVVIDAEGLLFINSKVVGYFATLYSSLRKQNRPLLITRMNENIQDILTLVGLTTLIPAFTTLEDAFKIL
jgi:anti-anti-sigma factor